MTDGADSARIFLAVPISGAARAALSAALRDHGPLPGRPVPPESWHLTLRFLGDTPAAARERLREEVSRAPLGAPFAIRFGRFGAFPRASRATVLWLGVEEGAEPLRALAAEVEAAACRAGFPAEGRPFRPHLTLSRIRTPADASSLLDRLPPFPEPMPVTEVVLYRSHLGRGPARYEALGRFPLGARPDPRLARHETLGSGFPTPSSSEGAEMQLSDRVAIVTGAGSGIGKAAALLLAREGARVAALSRTEEELRETVEAIESGGGEGMVVCADVSDPDEMRRAVEQVVERWGRIDVVVANAGVNGVWAPLEELDPEEWDRTLEINLKGTFLSLKYTVPHLKRRGGSVVVVASINGTRVFSNSGATAYACSKAGQVAFAKMAALELARDRVRVNVVCPGAIDTEIEENTEHRGIEELGVPVEFPQGWHPLRGAPGTAEQVARLVLFLASDASDHVTGTEMWIDGGESLIGIHG